MRNVALATMWNRDLSRNLTFIYSLCVFLCPMWSPFSADVAHVQTFSFHFKDFITKMFNSSKQRTSFYSGRQSLTSESMFLIKQHTTNFMEFTSELKIRSTYFTLMNLKSFT